MNSVHTRTVDRIKRQGPGAVVTPKDFLDLGTRDAVDQTLTRLVRLGTLTRLCRGVYHYPRFNQTLGLTVPPDPDAVAHAIGRQTGTRVVPSDAVAANSLGLSTQVPAQSVYLTDGPARSVRIGCRVIQMKHVAAKRLPPLDGLPGLAFQAIQNAGPNGMDDKGVASLRRRLSPRQRADLLKQARYADGWVADAARRVAQMQRDT